MKVYAVSIQEAFKAAKESLHDLGYTLEKEDESQGLIVTKWQSTKAASHYLDLFDKKDFGTVGAYYRLNVKIADKEGKSEVQVSAPVRSVISGRMQTDYSEEKKLLRKIADKVRKEDFEMNNIGVME